MKKIIYIITNNLEEFVGIEIRRDSNGIYLINCYIPFTRISNIRTVGLITEKYIKYII